MRRTAPLLLALVAALPAATDARAQAPAPAAGTAFDAPAAARPAEPLGPWRPVTEVAAEAAASESQAPGVMSGKAGAKRHVLKSKSPGTVESTEVPAAARSHQRLFWRCSPGLRPCTRSNPARLVLALSGLLAIGAGAAWLVVADDSVGGGGPGTLLGSGGSMMVAGALLGGLAGLVGGDGTMHPDRVRPETVGVGFTTGTGPVLGEYHPGTMQARWAPSWYFPDDRGRLRLMGYAGGALGREVQVDPRPQSGAFAPLPGTRRSSFGLGLDLALTLPYPVLDMSRSAWLGAVELRVRPEVHVRRDVYFDDDEAPLLMERTIVLPATFGIRWHLSARQRFTAYAGPRLDFLAFSATGARPLHRGPPQVGNFHGEFWYDIDVPLTPGPVDRRGRARRAAVNSQVTLGYVHSRFGPAGLNIGKVVGYFGVFSAAYRVRVRPRAAAYALQFGAGASIGHGFGGFFELGVALPDLGLPRVEERRAI